MLDDAVGDEGGGGEGGEEEEEEGVHIKFKYING